MTDEEYETHYDAGGSLANELMTKLRAEARARFLEMNHKERGPFEDGFWDTLYEII